MEYEPLPFRARLAQYKKQAEELLEAHKQGQPQAIRLLHENHPRFLDAKIPWLPRDLSAADIQATPLDRDDAELTIARCYSFKDWPALQEYVEAVGQDESPVCQFESAVEAVIDGAQDNLQALLRANPDLVRARSTRVTRFDPPVHRATLLHYVAANGVEGHRQKTPPNAVEIATTLLEAGAVVDALADLYGAPCTTMTLLVSSCHPANAGVQVALVDTLLDFGAAIEGIGSRKWGSPLMTALAFGYPKTAEALVRRGARVEDLATAAGLGRLADSTHLLTSGADGETRHLALALAAQLGHLDVVRLLLDAGEDPSRYNPAGLHPHATPLHQAVLAGHDAVVRLLVERRASLGIRDTIYQGTPLGWALYAEQTAIAEYLRSAGGDR